MGPIGMTRQKASGMKILIVQFVKLRSFKMNKKSTIKKIPHDPQQKAGGHTGDQKLFDKIERRLNQKNKPREPQDLRWGCK
jgi:ATP:corrinoid adenosyltransferase